MGKRIVLCADDFGQAPAISQGILDLIKKKRLSATTCLVTSPYWFDHSRLLLAQIKEAGSQPREFDIGLHFNLTEGFALSKMFKEQMGETFPSLPTLLRRAYLKQLTVEVIASECLAQLDHFVEALGVWPDFMDGHQHIHQFPIIREALLSVYLTHLYPHNPSAYIRFVNETTTIKECFKDLRQFKTHLKKMIIYTTGSRTFGKLLRDKNICHNPSFAGIYSFSNANNYRSWFQYFLRKVTNQGLIMCHPAYLNQGGSDKIADARYQEYLYFSSQVFLEDCRQNDVILTTFHKC